MFLISVVFFVVIYNLYPSWHLRFKYIFPVHCVSALPIIRQTAPLSGYQRAKRAIGLATLHTQVTCDTRLCRTWRSPLKNSPPPPHAPLSRPFHSFLLLHHRNAAQMFRPSDCCSICVINPVRRNEGANGGSVDRLVPNLKGQGRVRRRPGGLKTVRQCAVTAES